MAGGKLLYNTGSPARCSVKICEGWEGRVAQQGGDICIIMADLCCCRAETNALAFCSPVSLSYS